jgi:hypothetical protein
MRNPRVNGGPAGMPWDDTLGTLRQSGMTGGGGTLRSGDSVIGTSGDRET